ncbi:MAG: OmpA family protein [Saprospiraceae bacterium]|nr:OmpA family protein [Saprospiraceae bacterium]
MSAPIKVLIMLIVWLLYSLLAYRGCIQDCCKGGEDTIIQQDSALNLQRYPIDFQWSKEAANTNQGFDDLKSKLLAGMQDGQILEITGQYFEDEPKPDGFDNMGFARAQAVRALFPDIPDDRIKLRARLMDESEGVRNGYFEAALFEWIKPEEKIAQTVEELDDRIIIRFPYNSTEREYDPSVDEYLDKLAKRIASTGETVQLTGHTDNKGAPDYNTKLGMARAAGIKGVLTQKGVKADQISASSKGQEQPVDSNATEEGRHNNRRVEVRLIKKQQ